MTLLQEFKDFRKSHTPCAITHRQCRWEYLRSGTGKRTIVVLHGNGTNADGMWEYIRGFEKDFRIIAPTVPAGVHTMKETLLGIAAILRKEKVTRADFFGFSMGAMVAQCFVRAYPAMTRNIVLFSALPPDVEMAPQMRRELRHLNFLPDILLQFFQRRSIKKELMATKTPREEMEYWLTFGASVVDGKRMNKASLIASIQIMLDYASNYHFAPKDMKGRRSHVMIIEGDQDTIVNPLARFQLRDLYPKAEILTIANGGHAMFGAMRAEPILEKIVTFLKKN